MHRRRVVVSSAIVVAPWLADAHLASRRTSITRRARRCKADRWRPERWPSRSLRSASRTSRSTSSGPTRPTRGGSARTSSTPSSGASASSASSSRSSPDGRTGPSSAATSGSSPPAGSASRRSRSSGSTSALEQARLLGLALNKISGSWDEQLLARLLAELQADAELDLSLSGFDDDEIRDLLRSLEVREKRGAARGLRPRRGPRRGSTGTARRSPATCGRSATTASCAATRPTPDDVARLLDGADPDSCCHRPALRGAPSTRPGATACTTRSVRRAPYMRSMAKPRDATGARGATDEPGHRNTTLSGDTRVDWSEAFALVPSLSVGYVWHAGVHAAAGGRRASSGSASRSSARSSGTRASSRSAAPGTTGATSPAGSSARRAPRCRSSAPATRRRSGGCPARR